MASESRRGAGFSGSDNLREEARSPVQLQKMARYFSPAAWLSGTRGHGASKEAFPRYGTRTFFPKPIFAVKGITFCLQQATLALSSLHLKGERARWKTTHSMDTAATPTRTAVSAPGSP